MKLAILILLFTVAAAKEQTRTYGTYSMTHPATSTGVYSAGSTNTYGSGTTIYYPQGSAVTYNQACQVYYPAQTTVSTNSGSYTYPAGTYVNYPAGAQVAYSPGSTCYFARQTSCTYGSYNGASGCAVRYPAQTPVTCVAPSQPTYYGPGQYNAGVQYYNYNGTGGTSYVNNPDGTRSSVCNVGYTQNGYPVNYVYNQNTGAATCVTQTGQNSYISYNGSGVSQGSSPYG